MLWYVLVFLLILWLFGVIGNFGGYYVHLLLVIALILLVVQLVTRRQD